MEWTREKTLQLISEYQKRRGLWDMTCDEYRKKDVKQRLLIEVSGVLGGNIAIQELEKKFHTLRTQYHREISRMKRKEPYNSKWFGFKYLVFLSSPYACRSTKGRLKSDGGTPKYILNELPANAVENNDTATATNCAMNDEYVSSTRSKSHASSRAQELEKLIEETTKDVDEMEEQDIEDVDSKPKLVKDISVPYVQMNEDEAETIENQQQQHHQQQQQHQQSMIDLHHTSTVEAVSFQANESGELHYQATAPSGNANGSAVHVVPTRIIKIQRRDTCQDDGYYDDHPTAPKRIYYDATNSHNATILSASTLSTAQNGNGNNLLTNNTATTLRLPRVNNIINASLSPPKPATSPVPVQPPQLARDEFSTYGEYVANEMRAISNREVLISLKHKINTAIFEANTADLQK